MERFEQPDGPWRRAALPRPFVDATRSDDVRRALDHAYSWREYIRLLPPSADELHADADRIEAGEGPVVLDDEPTRSVLALVTSHGVDPIDIVKQIRAAATMRGSVRFADAADLDAFVDLWTASHARILAAIGGIGQYSWQQSLISELSRGFFLTAALMTLEEDVADGHVFFPLSDAEAVGMDVEELNNRVPGAAVRRFLWKQTVRARDSFAQSQRLIDDLDRKQAAAFRRWWFASLEVLNQIEKSDFDLWFHPPHLSAYHRAHVRFQARFGRTTFR